MRCIVRIPLICGFLILISLGACDNNAPEELIEFPPAPGINYVETYGQLHVAGGKLRNESGNVVQLKGMSTYWLNWEPGMKYANADVVRTLAREWNASVLRIAMGVNPGDGSGYIMLGNRNELKRMVDVLARACIDNGIYFIIDWHSYNSLHLADEEAAFFTEIANEYGGYPNILYELYNEPGQFESWSESLKPYQEHLIQDVIRPIDADNIIIIGSRQWDQSLDECADDPITGNNLMYGFHFYAAGHNGDIGREMRGRVDYAIQKGLAVFATEWGPVHWDWTLNKIDTAEADVYIDWMDANNIGWTNWSICDLEEAASALKPGALSTGEWTSRDLTPSGKFIRWKLLE